MATHPLQYVDAIGVVSGFATTTWTNPQNITDQSDAGFGVFALGANTTDYGSYFSFNAADFTDIPSTAVITGITIAARLRATSTNRLSAWIQLGSANGSYIGTEYQVDGGTTLSTTVNDYGMNAVWDVLPTRAQLASGTFGAKLRMRRSNTVSAELYTLKATVTYEVPDTTAPTNPSSLAATDVAAPVLTWTASTDAVGVTKYEVERSTTSGSGFAKIGEVTGAPPTTTYTDTTAASNTTYYYRVRALDAAANASGYSNEDTGITPITYKATLDWADNLEADLAGYNVYRATVSGGTFTKINGSLVAASAYTDTPLPDNAATYYYKVTAVDTAPNESAFSAEVSTAGGGTALTRSASDAIAASDSVTPRAALKRTQADTVAATDTATPSSVFRRSASDTVAASDSTSRVLRRAVSDAAGIADSTARATRRTVSEAVSVADTATSAVSGVGIVRTVSDTVAATDATSKAQVFKRSVSDAPGITDATARTIRRAVSDTVAAADTATSSEAIKRTTSDAESVADAAARAVSYVRLVGGKTFDSLSGQTFDSLSGQTFAQQTEGVGVSDTATPASPIKRTATDAVGVADATARVIRRTVADSASVADSSSAVRAIRRTVSDAAPIVDSTSAVGAGSIVRTVSDTVAAADVASKAQVIRRSVSDAPGITDATARTIRRSVSDTVAATDSTSAAERLNRSATDAAPVADAATPNLVSGGITRSASDVVALLDAASVKRSIRVSVGDAVALADTASTPTPPSLDADVTHTISPKPRVTAARAKSPAVTWTIAGKPGLTATLAEPVVVVTAISPKASLSFQR